MLATARSLTPPSTLATDVGAALWLPLAPNLVVVAVSEETGAISYAYKGQFVRRVTLEELRAFLTSVLVSPSRSRNWLGWFRVRTADEAKPGPVRVARTDSPAATASKGGGQ